MTFCISVYVTICDIPYVTICDIGSTVHLYTTITRVWTIAKNELARL